MPITISWEQIALRVLLALVASFLIGFDRHEHGKTSGVPAPQCSSASPLHSPCCRQICS